MSDPCDGCTIQLKQGLPVCLRRDDIVTRWWSHCGISRVHLGAEAQQALLAFACPVHLLYGHYLKVKEHAKVSGWVRKHG